MKAVLRREDPEHGGIPRFERAVADRLEDRGWSAITFDAGGGHPLGEVVTRRRVGAAIRRYADGYDAVLVPAQTYLSFVEPDSIDADVVPYVHDIFPVTTNFSGPVATWLGMRYVRALGQCDTVLCNSDAVRQELVERAGYDGRAETVHQGIGIAAADDPRGYDERAYDLIYVGALTPRKDPATVRRMARAADERGLAMVAVNKEPLDLPCEVRTGVSDDELRQLYDDSRYYLHPSFLEGFGRGPVEAQRRGCVPIARDTAVNQEILGEFVELTGDVLGRIGPDDWQQRHTAAIENSKRFDWDRTVEEIVEVVG